MPDTTDLLAHPLPVAWDGRPVTWSDWRPGVLVFICDRSKRKHGLSHPACGACGSITPAPYAFGLREPAPGATIPGEYLRTHRNGRPVYSQEPAPAYRDLIADRCPDCGTDSVYDLATDEAWTLDETDYGPAGSVA